MKKLIYLISPNKIYKNFYTDLDLVLATKKVKFFQLRLKKRPLDKIIKIAKKIKVITSKHKVKLIINDYLEIALKVNADGCHFGQLDGPIARAKRKLKRKIIGVTCHGSKDLAHKDKKNNADYIAFGSFYKSRLKPAAKKANIKEK